MISLTRRALMLTATLVFALLFLAACEPVTLKIHTGLGTPTNSAPAKPAEAPAKTQTPPAPQAAPLEPLIEESEMEAASIRPPRLVPPTGLAEQPVKVALLLPLSGPNAGLGLQLLNAAQMALFDIGNPRLMLLPADTKGTPEGAARAAMRVLGEGAELILGPVFAGSVAAVAPLATERQVGVIAFSTDRSVARPGVYLMGLTVDQQIDRVISHARRSGLFSFAVLAPETRYGEAVIDALKAAVARHGGEVGQIVTYSPGIETGSEALHEKVRQLADYDRRRKDLLEQRKLLEERDDPLSQRALKRLEHLDTYGELPFDAVLLPEGGTRLRAIAPLLPFYDIDPAKIRLIGTGLWADSTLGAEPALVRGWFAAPPPENARQFRDRYQSFYGAIPPRIASLAYDALALAAALAGGAEGQDFSTTALQNPAGFAGYDGIFRFGKTGIAERGLAVIEIEANGLKVINPAPASFEGLVN